MLHHTLSNSVLAIGLFLSGASGTLAATATPSPTPATRTVKLKWAASPSPSVTGYKLYWGTGNGNYQNTKDVKNVLMSSLILSAATDYYIVAKAYDQYGESGLSNQVKVPAVSGYY